MGLEEFALAVLVSVITAIVTSLLYWRRVEADLKKEYESRFNQKKWDVYTSYVQWYGSAYANAGSDDAETDEEFANIISLLLLVGSDDVITAHNRYINDFRIWKKKNDINRVGSKKDELNQIQLKQMDVLSAMRADLGFSTRISKNELFLTLISPAVVMLQAPTEEG